MSMFKKLFFVCGLALLVLSFSACRFSKDVALEAVFPKDASMVMVVDASNDEQLDNAKKLVDTFPDTGVWALFKMGLIQGMNSEGVSYEEDFKPIFEGDWRFGFSVTFPEELKNAKSMDDLNSLDDIGPDEFGLFLAFETDAPEVIENLLQKKVDEEKLKFEKVDGAKYWSDSSDDGVFVKYDDVFFLTVTRAMAQEAIGRLENGGGFEAEKITTDNLGYLYFDLDSIKNLVSTIYDNYGLDYVSSYMDVLGENWISLSAEKSGFRVKVNSQIIGGEEALKAIGMDVSRKIGLMDKVGADGIFLYAEDYSLANALKPIIQAISLDVNLLSDLAAEAQPAKDYYSDFLSNLAALASTDVDTLTNVLDSPFAIVASDVGGVLPGVAVYVNLDESKSEQAKTLVLALNAYLDAVVLEFEQMLIEQELPTEVIKKDLVTVGGAVLHKLSLDLAAYPEGHFDLLSDYAGFDLTAVPLELYYGVTGDNVFVIALYPGFEKIYGKNLLSADADFNQALKMIAVDSQKLMYFNPARAVNSIMHFVKIAAAENPEDADVLAQYEKSAKSFVETIKFIVSGDSFKDGYLFSDGFVKIEKVEKKAEK